MIVMVTVFTLLLCVIQEHMALSTLSVCPFLFHKMIDSKAVSGTLTRQMHHRLHLNLRHLSEALTQSSIYYNICKKDRLKFLKRQHQVYPEVRGPSVKTTVYSQQKQHSVPVKNKYGKAKQWKASQHFFPHTKYTTKTMNTNQLGFCCAVTVKDRSKRLCCSAADWEVMLLPLFGEIMVIFCTLETLLHVGFCHFNTVNFSK